MKAVLFLVLVSLVFTSCKDKIYNKYKTYVPVYMDLETFRASVKFEGAKSIQSKGNIYQKDTYLFIVEPNVGVHFIENSNPSSPNKFGFLRVPGCTNVAIKGNVMYVSSLIDLVCLDIQNIHQPVEINRLKDVFPEALPYAAKNYPKQAIDKTKGIVVDWSVVEVVEETDEVQQQGNWNGGPIMMEDVFTATGNSSGGASGTAGSISQFTILNNYLYAYDNHKLIPINIENETQPIAATGIDIWYDVETLFPSGNNIFMGTTTGMLIYSATNPALPTYVSSVSHVRSCDPVVVSGNYAYVTLRSSSWCGGDVNQLQIIDLTNINQPTVVKTFEMEGPRGLGIDANTLFICDGNDGLKIYNAENPLTCGDNMIERYKSIDANDVIANNNLAIVIGDDGLFQYDYTDKNDIKLLSKISFE